MGRGLIVSELGAGEYVVRRLYDTARMKARLSVIIAEIVVLDEEILALEAAVVALENNRGGLIAAMNTKIDEANSNLSNSGEFSAAYTQIVNAATAEITNINNKLVVNSFSLSPKKIELAAKKITQKNIDEALAQYDNSQPVSAWCADYNTGLSGDVGTIELNDESNAPNDDALIIKPAGVDGVDAVWLAGDKTTQPVMSSGTSAIVYNSIVLPALQKWRPKYRAGIISNIDTALNTCDVSFTGEEQYSSIESYNGNGFVLDKYAIFQVQTLSAVTVDYLFCHAKAFSDDDRVVVRFDPDADDVISSATVIGFTENPKQCEPSIYIRHYGGGIWDDVYEYDAEGNPPKLIADLDSVGSGLAIVDSGLALDAYHAKNDGDVYKNNVQIIPELYEAVIVAGNSTNLIVQDSSLNARFYDFGGAFVKTLILPSESFGTLVHAVNDHGIIYQSVDISGDSEMSIVDLDGNLLAIVPAADASYELMFRLSGASKSAFFLADTNFDYTNLDIGVYSKSGLLMGTYTIARSTFGDIFQYPPCVGYTDSRVFLFAAIGDVPMCQIYSHTLTIDSAGEVINAVLGSLLYTVNTPQLANSIISTFQTCANGFTPAQ